MAIKPKNTTNLPLQNARPRFGLEGEKLFDYKQSKYLAASGQLAAPEGLWDLQKVAELLEQGVFIESALTPHSEGGETTRTDLASEEVLAANEKLENQRIHLHTENSELKTQVEAFRATIDVQQADISNLNGDLNNANVAIEGLNAEISNLSDSLANADSQLAEKHNEIISLLDQVEALRAEIEASRQQVADDGELIKTLQAEADQLRGLIGSKEQPAVSTESPESEKTPE